MTIRAPFLMTVMALMLTACAMALGGPPAPHILAAQPFSCELLARPTGRGTELEGRLDARDAFSGSYELRVRGPGVAVDQAGELSLAAGQSALLGQASLSGNLSSLDASLTVTGQGRTVTCPVRQP
jgi:hypothetical protein